MAPSYIRICHRTSLTFLCSLRPLTATTGFGTLKSPPTQVRLCLVRQYSPSQTRQGISQGIVTRLKWANEKYERFLQRRLPRFYVLYCSFMKGFRLLFQDAKEVHKIRLRMITNNIDVENLPYREMEKLRQFRRDMIKAIPLVVISIPPFANYLVFVLMYLYPRQLLIRHFWTPQQLMEFQGVYHAQRARHHPAILDRLERTAPSIGDDRLKNCLEELCGKDTLYTMLRRAKVLASDISGITLLVRSGSHPVVSDLHAVRTLFSGPPLSIKRMYAEHMRHLCPLLFLTSRLPGFWIGWRLNTHALELMQLDRAILRLGLHQIDDIELREACYTRGLDVENLSPAQCRKWLSQWLQFSTYLKESETSLYLHSMVLLTVNYPKHVHS